MHRIAAVALACLLAPALASAATPERVVLLRPGAETVLPLGQAVRLHVDDPEVVSAEISESNELRLVGRSVGSTLLFLHGNEGLSAWLVRVGTQQSPAEREAAVAAARAACRSFERTAEGYEVGIQSASCHAAIVALSAHLVSSELVVRFDTDGLRAQMAAQQARLLQEHPQAAPGLQLVYLGATPRLSGRVASWEEADALLRTLWRATAGRFLVDLSRLQVGPPPPGRR
jgi:Flp pilus assembly secretin CpaC